MPTPKEQIRFLCILSSQRPVARLSVPVPFSAGKPLSIVCGCGQQKALRQAVCNGGAFWDRCRCPGSAGLDRISWKAKSH